MRNFVQDRVVWRLTLAVPNDQGTGVILVPHQLVRAHLNRTAWIGGRGKGDRFITRLEADALISSTLYYLLRTFIAVQ